MTNDLWSQRDLPVLSACVEHYDDPKAHRSKLDLKAATGLDDEAISRALKALGRAEPPYLNIARSMGPIEQGSVLGVTERAYRAVGAWPTPEGLAADFAAAFDQAADAETDPEQKSKLKAIPS